MPLLSAPGAPLKKALLDAGIGKDILSSYENGIAQPYFSVIAKHAREDQKDEFMKVVRETLEGIVKTDLTGRLCWLASITMNSATERQILGIFQEDLCTDYRCLTAGSMMRISRSFHLIALDRFAKMREKLDESYFEALIRTWILDNPHGALLVLKPVPGLEAKQQEALAEKLKAYKDSLSEEELIALAAQTKELKEYQDEPSPQADLEKIPMLAREDIKREAAPFINEELNVEGTTVLHQNLFTSGINYIRLLFDAKEVPADLIPYLGLLKHVLGYMDTDNYNYGELFNEINCHTGGITSTVNLYGNMREPEKYRIMVELRCKALVSDTDFGFAMMREILSRTRLTDTKRLYEIVAQVKSRLQMYLTGSGHSAAAVRAMAEFSDSSWVTDQISGIAFYGLIEQLEKHFEEKKDQIVENLKLVMQYVLRPENLIVSCTSETDGLEAVKKELPALKACLNTLPVPERTRTEELLKRPVKAEGIKTPSAVQYVARAGHIKKYYGTYRILKVILSYDYLWIQVRVKGGAYGCMSGFGTYGDSYLVSYRDPNLGQTNEVFEQTPEYGNSLMHLSVI